MYSLSEKCIVLSLPGNLIFHIVNIISTYTFADSNSIWTKYSTTKYIFYCFYKMYVVGVLKAWGLNKTAYQIQTCQNKLYYEV